MIFTDQASPTYSDPAQSIFRTSLLHGLGDANLPATGLQLGSSKNPFATKIAGTGTIYKNGKPIIPPVSDYNVFATSDGTTLHWGDEQPGYLYAKADWYETTYQQMLNMIERNAGNTKDIAYNLDNALAYSAENLFPIADALGMTPKDAATFIFKNSSAYSKAEIADLLSKAALAQASITALQAMLKNSMSTARDHDNQAMDIENSLFEQAKNIFKAQPNTFAIASVISTVDQSTLDALNQVAGAQMISYYANDKTLTSSTQDALDKTATAAVSIALNSDTVAKDVAAAQTALTDTLSKIDNQQVQDTLDTIGFSPVTITTKKVDGSPAISITTDGQDSIALTNQIAKLSDTINALEQKAKADQAAAAEAAAAAAKAQADALAKAAADAQAAIKTAADQAAAAALAAQAKAAADAAARAKADADAVKAKSGVMKGNITPLLWIAGAAFLLGKL